MARLFLPHFFPPAFFRIYAKHFFNIYDSRVTCVWLQILWIWTFWVECNLQFHFHVLLMNVMQCFNHRNGRGLFDIEISYSSHRFSYCVKLSIIYRKSHQSHQKHSATAHRNEHDCTNLNLLIELLCNQASFSIVSINSTQICSAKVSRWKISTNEQEKFSTL